MNTGVRYLDDLKAISDNDLFRVRGVPGVLWAVNLYRGSVGSKANWREGCSSKSLRKTRGTLRFGVLNEAAVRQRALHDPMSRRAP